MSGITVRGGPSRQPSIASTSSAIARTSSPAAGGNTYFPLPPSQRFRKLTWDASIPIAVTIESSDLSNAGAVDRSIESYYVRAPRITYLPLLLQEIKQGLLSIMLDEAALDKIAEEDYWFTYEGIPLRWHWPLGLLYDYHTGNMAPTTCSRPASVSTSASQAQGSTFRRASGMSATSAAAAGPTESNGAVSTFVSPQAPVPWCITLRIGNVPTDKLQSVPGLNNCRASFMSMVKEADFVRHGSTKRVTNLRRTEQDALWDGVVQHNFDAYWSVASKLIPSPISSSDELTTAPANTRSLSFSAAGAETSAQVSSNPSSVMQHANESLNSLHSAAPSESNVSVAESTTTARTTTSSYRSMPMRFHLVSGAPVVQEPVAPVGDDGRSVTLHTVLSALFPLLFPPTPTFSTTSNAGPPTPLAYAVIQGIRVPLDAEIAWIGSVLPFADGWVSVCIHLLADGERM